MAGANGALVAPETLTAAFTPFQALSIATDGTAIGALNPFHVDPGEMQKGDVEAARGSGRHCHRPATFAPQPRRFAGAAPAPIDVPDTGPAPVGQLPGPAMKTFVDHRPGSLSLPFGRQCNHRSTS